MSSFFETFVRGGSARGVLAANSREHYLATEGQIFVYEFTADSNSSVEERARCLLPAEYANLVILCERAVADRRWEPISVSINGCAVTAEWEDNGALIERYAFLPGPTGRAWIPDPLHDYVQRADLSDEERELLPTTSMLRPMFERLLIWRHQDEIVQSPCIAFLAPKWALAIGHEKCFLYALGERTALPQIFA